MKKDSAAVLGVLGGGQLAKMLGMEAYRLGLRLAIIENGHDSPAGMMTKMDYGKGWNDKKELDKFINTCTYITLENEFIDPDIISYIETKKPVYPSSTTMRLVRDKYIQKKTFAKNGIPVTPFAKIKDKKAAKEFGSEYGYPFVIKSREMGYDGYGNYTVKDESEITKALEYFSKNKSGIKLMAEAFVSFDKELAVMAVRSVEGEEVSYPCVETIQKNHICHTVLAPAEIHPEIAKRAQIMAIECVRSINGIGVFGVEFFYDKSGNLLVNEIAPRPHNSGHYTIEACYTSQFENCIRAITGQPLGSAAMREKNAVMMNVLGDAQAGPIPQGLKQSLSQNRTKLHLYGKANSREGRKMGHLTTTGQDKRKILEDTNKSLNTITWKS